MIQPLHTSVNHGSMILQWLNFLDMNLQYRNALSCRDRVNLSRPCTNISTATMYTMWFSEKLIKRSNPMQCVEISCSQRIQISVWLTAVLTDVPVTWTSLQQCVSWRLAAWRDGGHIGVQWRRMAIRYVLTFLRSSITSQGIEENKAEDSINWLAQKPVSDVGEGRQKTDTCSGDGVPRRLRPRQHQH